MVALYLDTSALVKHYVDEPGSHWIHSQFEEDVLITSSLLTLVETLSAFNRRVREGGLTGNEYLRLRSMLYHDVRTSLSIVPLNPSIADSAGTLLERHPLRSYDAIHLATALAVHRSLSRHNLTPLVFVSADDRLNNAASEEGMAVENPNHHASV
jgi:uncharacterized protein